MTVTQVVALLCICAAAVLLAYTGYRLVCGGDSLRCAALNLYATGLCVVSILASELGS